MGARSLSRNSAAHVAGRGHYEWAILSDVTAIQPLVDEVVALCRGAGFGGKHCRLNVPVALTEALSNAVMRGNRNESSRYVKVTARISSVELVVDVADEGYGFDHTRTCNGPQDSNWLEREDGRGLFLMRALMDEVEHKCAPPPQRGHTVRLVLRKI